MARVKYPAQVKDEKYLETETMQRTGPDAKRDQGRVIATERMLESMFGQGNVTGNKGFNFAKAVCTNDGGIVTSQNSKYMKGLGYDTDYKVAQNIAGYFAKNPNDSLIILHPEDKQPHYLRCEKVGNDYIYSISEDVAEPKLTGKKLENWKKEFIEDNKAELEKLELNEDFQKAQEKADDIIDSEYDRIKQDNPDFENRLDDADIDLQSGTDYLNDFMKSMSSPEPYVPSETPNLNSFCANNQTIFVSDIDKVVSESPNDPNLADKVIDSKMKNPAMSYDDFVKTCSIPEEKKLGDIQRYTRQEISRTATKTFIQASQKYVQARPTKTYNVPPSDRQFKAVMCSGELKDRTRNEQICELFSKLKDGTATHADKVKMCKAINERYAQILNSDNGAFDRSYNDEELAKNWGKLHENIKGAGMEYIGVRDALNKYGLKIDSKLQERMDQFHKKADAFNMKYQNRMNYITSNMYQYGGEEEALKTYKTDPAAFFKAGPEAGPELANLGNICTINEQSEYTSLGIMGLKDQCKDKSEILGIRDKDNNEIEIMMGTIGQALKDGKELTIVYKDGREPKVISAPDSNDFPPKIENKAPTKENKAIDIMTRFDKTAEAIQKGGKPEAVQNLEEDILMDQYKLSAIANNIDAPGNKKEYMRTMATLAARLTVQQKLNEMGAENGGHIDNDTAEFLSSPDRIKKIARELANDGVIKQMVEKIPPDKKLDILSIDNDGLFSKLTESTKAAEKAQNEPQLQGPQAEKQAQAAQPAQKQM